MHCLLKYANNHGVTEFFFRIYQIASSRQLNIYMITGQACGIRKYN